jgi:enoyl-[acyl-carrier protein] reductase II
METKLFDRLAKQGHDFLGVRYPIICGAMTWVSDPNLVASVCNAGGFACLAGGNTPVEILEKQILDTRKLTDKPFGVNLITIAPLYKEHLELMQRLNPPFINFAGSFPRRKEVVTAKETGAKVLCFASTHSIAMRMIDYGADALILEGMEAGGHVGHVALSILLQQVLFEVSEVPIFVGGGRGGESERGHRVALSLALASARSSSFARRPAMCVNFANHLFGHSTFVMRVGMYREKECVCVCVSERARGTTN